MLDKMVQLEAQMDQIHKVEVLVQILDLAEVDLDKELICLGLELAVLVDLV
jgi:hypothetical protein